MAIWQESLEERYDYLKSLAKEYSDFELKGRAVVYNHRNWQIVICADTGQLHGEKDLSGAGYGRLHTRIRAPYRAKSDLQINIYPETLTEKICKIILPIEDIHIGYQNFDKAFIIQSNDEKKMQKLFQSKELRKKTIACKDFNLLTCDCMPWFGRVFPNDLHELHFTYPNLMKNFYQIRKIVFAYAMILDRLLEMDLIEDHIPTLEFPDNY